MKMNDLQKTLLQTYAGGEFAHIQRGEDLRDCGDGLLKFLFEELDNDCYAEAERLGVAAQQLACKRLGTAMGNVLDVLVAL